MLTPPTTAPLLSSALSGATWSTEDRTNVTAASDGSIVQVAFDGTFGTYVVQTLPDGKYLSYSGLRSASVAVGERILAGDVIGTSTLSLHVVISDSVTGYKGDGTAYDPADYFALPEVNADGDVPDPAALIEAMPETVPNVIEVGASQEAAPTQVIPAGTYDDPTAVIDPVTTSAATVTPVLVANPAPVALNPQTAGSVLPPVTPTTTSAGSYTVTTTNTSTPASGGSTWVLQGTAMEPAVPVPPAPVEPPEKHLVDQIVADALATPKSAAAPIAHQAKGAPVKGGLANLISLPFWNDTLTRAFNTFLQVGLTSIGAGAVHLFSLSDITSLKIAAGAAAVSLIQSLIRATSQAATSK